MPPAMTPQQRKLSERKVSALTLYKEMVVGKGASAYSFIIFEFSQLFAVNLGGGFGFFLRMLLYPKLFAGCGKKVVFGKGILLRSPAQVRIGNKCLIDDNAVLDARGDEAKIELGDNVTIGRGSAVVAKNSQIEISAGVNIGSSCRIATQSKIEIGESSLIAAYVYIGPGNHKVSSDGRPLIEEEMEIKGGVKIGKNVWIGTRATILDGVTIGDGAIIGAHSFVTQDVPAGKKAVGTPARIL